MVLKQLKQDVAEQKALQKVLASDLGERFVVVPFIPKGATIGHPILVVDRETGIEYLHISGLTPLLNPDGSPKINKQWQEGLL